MCDPVELDALGRSGENGAQWCEGDQSLSKYIWAYLGNPCPEGICNLDQGPKLLNGIATGIGNAGWTTINLNNSYTSMVVITTPVYGLDQAPLVTRIRNVTNSSFELMVQKAANDESPIDSVEVHYLVVEEGAYQQSTHGVTMEAVKYESKVTDRSGSWKGESRNYHNSYINPVVLGQVMSFNDHHFSTFWSRGRKPNKPANSTTLKTGKHVAEDALTSRNNETIGYLVIESGEGEIGGISFLAAHGADIVRGMQNGIYSYLHSVENPMSAVAIQSAMDGRNGGWAVLAGEDPLNDSKLSLAIDEDQIRDSERLHTTEQVDYIIFGNPRIPAPDTLPPAVPTGLFGSSVSSDDAVLEWNPSSDNVGVVSYTLYRDGQFHAFVSAPGYTDTEVTEGAGYEYRVMATDAAGNLSELSEPLSVVIPSAPDTQAPTIPTGLRLISVTDTQVALIWDASQDNEFVAGYKLYRDGVLIKTLPGLTYSDTGLFPTTNYGYRVLAYDTAGNESDLSNALSVTTQNTTVPDPNAQFKFVVFGDFNQGGCARNDRANQMVQRLAVEEADAAFFVSTGDIIDGYFESGNTVSCFAHDPVATAGASSCGIGVPDGNMAQILSPIKDRPPVDGLASSFYLALGNHDDNWGSGWYPDPCNGGICDFLAPNVPGDFINHDFNPSTICSTQREISSYPENFYYSFTYKNSYFIILRQNNDYYGMLSCNGGHPGYASCADYCSEESLFNDANRNRNCYNVEQFDWLRAELEKANNQGFEHIFVFTHAPMITSSERHAATHGAPQIRALLEKYNVEIFFNGHNHAYERSHPLRGNNIDSNGTVYITTGSGGADSSGLSGDWFTAFDANAIATYREEGFAEKMTTWLEITVNGEQVDGKVYSLGYGNTVVDDFTTTNGGPTPEIVISDITVSAIATDTATLNWSTMPAASGYVQYGLAAEQLDGTATVSMLNENQSVELTGLQSDSTYYYRVVSTIGALSVSSEVRQFSTLPQVTSSEVPMVGGCQLFPVDNMWNTPIDQYPVHPNSTTYTNSMGSDTTLHPDFGTVWNGMTIGIPFDIIPDTQEFVGVTFEYHDETDPLNIEGPVKPYPVPELPTIEGGADPHVLTGDNHVLLVRQGSCMLYELFATVKNSNEQWMAGSGAIWDLSKNEVRGIGVTSADAAGLAILPGLIRYEEVFGDPSNGIEPGINHAIRITHNLIQHAYVRPASHSDGQMGYNRAFPPMGLRLRLKSDVDISGFDEPIQVIFRAFKKYGVVIADTGGDMYVSGTHDMRWSDDQLRQLRSLKTSDFEAVDTGPIIDY